MSIKSILIRAAKYVITGIPTVIVKPEVTLLAQNKLLYGRVALITGGTSGIGYEIAKAYLNAGAKVIITGRNQKKLESAVATLTTYGECIGMVFDVSNIDTIESKLAEAVSVYDKIDILVNNAGISGANIYDATEEKFDQVIGTNLKGVFFLSKAIGKYMKDNGIHGNILNISSASSIRPAACAYTISKWGIRGFTQGLARTLLPFDIVVNALAPGPTATPLLKQHAAALDDYSLPNTPAGRYAMPEEIANMAVILVSNMSRLIVGDTVFMTGGAGNINNGDQDYPF